MDAHVARAPEDGVMGGDAPCAFHHKKEIASSRGWLVPGCAGGKDSQIWPRYYNVATSPYHRPGKATDKNTQHPRAGRISFSPETCKQGRSYSILSPQDSSERNRPGCLSLKR